MKKTSITEPARETPVVADVDVVVAGGGPAGLGAAIAAARAGAGTLLIERYGFLGGMWTAGLVNPLFDYANKGGIAQELVDTLARRNAFKMGKRHTFDPEMMKHVLDEMVLGAGAEILFHSPVVASVVEDRTVRGVIVENKGGRRAVLAKVVIDCTGDGDAAARAGAEFEFGRPEDGLVQPVTTMFMLSNCKYRETKHHELFEMMEKARERGADYEVSFTGPSLIELPREGEAVVMMTHVRRVNPLDAGDLSAAAVKGRRLALEAFEVLSKHVPEFEGVALSATAPQIGVRESRRIMGEYRLDLDDVLEGRHFPDGICKVTFGIDIHDPVELGFKKMPRIKPYQIPYRCLVPKEIDGLLVAGRCISGSHEAHASYRVTGNCMAMGQAAGTAAALSVRDGVRPRDVEINKLLDALTDAGARLSG